MAVPRFDSATVVLGMHRSGTSALAGALRLCGLAAAKSVMPADAANERGFWESAAIKALDDEMLETLGQSWHGLMPIRFGELREDQVARARKRSSATLMSEYDRGARIVLKEPRLCRLLPIWEPVLQERAKTVSYALIVRNPTEVARSLAQRNDFELNHGLLLWARYSLDAEIHTRGRRRLLVSYSTLLDDPRDTIKSVSEGLDVGLELNRSILDAVADYLSPDLRHQRQPDDASLAGKPQLIADTYRILREWCEGQVESEADHQKLDAAREELDRMALSVADVVERARLDRKRWTTAKAQLEQTTSELTRLQRSFEQLQELRQTLSEQSQSHAAGFSQLIAALDDRARLEQALADSARAGAEAATRLERLADEAAQAAESFARQTAQLESEHRGTVEQLQSEKEALRSANEALVAELEAEKVAVQSARARTDAIDAELQRTKRKYRGAQWDVEREKRAHHGTQAQLAAAEATLERYRGSLPWRAYVALSESTRRVFTANRRSTRKRRKEELQSIASSGLFDCSWYLITYPDVAAAGMDPLTHFVETGWREGRDPGPDFATSAYLKANPDVAQSGINPLFHYIEFGRSEGREVRAHRNENKEPAPIVHEFPEPAPVFRGEKRPDQPVRWQRSYRLERSDRRAVTAGELVLGYAEEPRLRSAIRSAFDRLADLSGLAVAHAPVDFDLEYASGSLIDAWYTNKTELRTRWRDDRGPFVIRAYQHNPLENGRLVLVGEGLLTSELDVVDLSLCNPFFPVLLLFADADGSLRGARLMAFPSLCRGGLHYSELISGSANDPDPLGTGIREAVRLQQARNSADRLIQLVSIDTSGDDGTSPMSDRAFRQWLERIAQVDVGADDQPDSLTDDARSPRGRLVLASDMIPTIHVLGECRRGGERAAASAFLPLLIAGEEPSQPAVLVELPRGASAILSVGASGYPAPWPRFLAGAAGQLPSEGEPAAIRLPNGPTLSDFELLVPAAESALLLKHEDPTDLTWMISAADWEQLQLLQSLRALSLQAGASAHHIAFVGEVGPVSRTAAEEFFGERVRIFPDMSAAASEIGTSLVGHIGPGVVLHDQRSVSALAALLADPAVASAACALVTTERRGKGWHVSVVDGGTIALDLSNGRTVAAEYSRLSLPWRSSLAVFRPPRDLWIAPASAVKSWIHSGAPQPLRKGMHACTSLVTASYLGARAEHACEIPLPSAAAGRSTKTKTLFG